MPSSSGIEVVELWLYGVAAVRFPTAVRSRLAKLLGVRANAPLPIVLECDNVEVLKSVTRLTDSVIALTLVAAASDVEAGTLVALNVTGLPPLYADMGIVVMRGRSLSPMADLIVRRLPTLVASRGSMDTSGTYRARKYGRFGRSGRPR